MKELKNQLHELEENEYKLRKEFESYQQKLSIYKHCKKDYDLMLHQKSLLDDQLSKSSYARVSNIYVYLKKIIKKVFTNIL